MKLILLLLLTLTVGIINNSNQETDKALLEKIEKLENELNELKQWKENIINKRKKRYDVESDIIDKKDYLDLLYGRLENNIYLKHKHFYLKRIYNSQKDGRCLKDLYSKCDKKKNDSFSVRIRRGNKIRRIYSRFYCLPQQRKRN